MSILDKRMEQIKRDRAKAAQNAPPADAKPTIAAPVLVETPATVGSAVSKEGQANASGALRLVGPPVAKASETPASATIADSFYTEERRERTEFEQGFERKTHIMLEGTVPGIDFGNILTPESPSSGSVETAEADPCGEKGHLPGHVWGLGMRPATVRGRLSLVTDSSEQGDSPKGDAVYAQLVDGANPEGTVKSGVLSFLEKHSLAVHEGPYADKDGKVAEFADIVFKGVRRDALFELIERIIDIRPFEAPETEIGSIYQRKYPLPLGFISRMDFMPTDELPSAGNILGQQSRSMQFKSIMKFQLVHPMEPYILAVAALRTRAYDAYPGIAILTDSGDRATHTEPLIVVIDMKNQTPLTTFDLKRLHPFMDAMAIMSDAAVMGALHAMRAETRCKHLAAEMVERSKTGAFLPVEDVSAQLHRISRSIFESAKRWDGNPFIPRVMTLLHGVFGNALMESMINVHAVKDGEEAAEALNSRVDEITREDIDPAMLTSHEDPVIREAAMMLSAMVHSRANSIETVQTLFGAYISKAQKQGKK